MTPKDYAFLIHRFDELHALLLAQQRWMSLELARQRAMIEAVPIRTLSKAKLQQVLEMKIYREKLAVEDLERSFEKMLDSARDGVRLAQAGN